MSLHPLIEYAFTEGYSFTKKDSLHSKKFNTAILNKFESRVIDYSKSTQNFALKSMRQLSLNTKFLQKEISMMRQKEIPEFKL